MLHGKICKITLNDFKNAPLFKIVCREMNKVINYTYVTDQLFKKCVVTICRLILVVCVRSASLDVNVLVIDVSYMVLISVR